MQSYLLVFEFSNKKLEKATGLSKYCPQRYSKFAMNSHDVSAYDCSFPHIQRRFRGRGNNILVGEVVKANVGELEEEVREGFTRHMRK